MGCIAIGNCRRDLLDHVIVLNERHLKRLMRDYIGYYHKDRTHLGFTDDRSGGYRASARRDARFRLDPLLSTR
jgi:hypothetical protein